MPAGSNRADHAPRAPVYFIIGSPCHAAPAISPLFPKDFKTAYKYFNTVHKNLPSDMPSKVMLERCARYAKSPPRNWDGTNIAQVYAKVELIDKIVEKRQDKNIKGVKS
jgi:hypothetical protein